MCFKKSSQRRREKIVSRIFDFESSREERKLCCRIFEEEEEEKKKKKIQKHTPGVSRLFSPAPFCSFFCFRGVLKKTYVREKHTTTRRKTKFLFAQ
jgi:hypothetical protein